MLSAARRAAVLPLHAGALLCFSRHLQQLPCVHLSSSAPRGCDPERSRGVASVASHASVKMATADERDEPDLVAAALQQPPQLQPQPNQQLSAPVSNIQHMSVHDGTGIRTAVFLCGCNLRCAWCHNPEAVYSNASTSSSVRRLTVEQVMERVRADAAFYAESRGGVTVTGGEPMMHPAFVRALLTACRCEGITTALETNLMTALPRDVLELCDEVFVDVKHTDPLLHAQLTGESNVAILRNLRALVQTLAAWPESSSSPRPQLTVRTPCVPDFTDSPAAVGAIATLVGELATQSRGALVAYELLPFNPLAAAKYTRMGRPWPYSGHSFQDEARVRALQAEARRALDAAGARAVRVLDQRLVEPAANVKVSERMWRLREESIKMPVQLSAERARLMTEFYRANDGRYSAPEMRARAFLHLCANKTIHIGADELLVGERGPAPKVVPTFPELTCHSARDFEILHSRKQVSYAVSEQTRADYEPVRAYWTGRSLRDRLFRECTDTEWEHAYASGAFTEFMEQRAPGHTVADDKVYRLGLRDLQARIAQRLTGESDPAARAQLTAMSIAADAAILFARRHAERARELAADPTVSPQRRAELLAIAEVCERVPAEAPRTFWEALQMYWFCHLAVITELNGWDGYSPGHLDQHLLPFYRRELAAGTLTRERAKELLCALFVKFNNHPAPPKVGVTAEESATYVDFTTVNLAGVWPDGSNAASDLSELLLEVIDDMHLVQPTTNVQLSATTPQSFLHRACHVIRHGFGFPSVFNHDGVVRQLVAQGKSVEDARAGGTSGCVESGAFGKEAYILTGYLNLAKILELALNDGMDPVSGLRLGPPTGGAATLNSMEAIMAAFQRQLQHMVEVKYRVNLKLERLYAENMPAPFLSLLTDDCIEKARDYNSGGARYNTSYIQGVGIGTVTDALAALEMALQWQATGGTAGTAGGCSVSELLAAARANFKEASGARVRQWVQSAPKWGNGDDRADRWMRRVFDMFHAAVDGRPNLRGGQYHIDMLPTTCHVYFGSKCGATPDGRLAGQPLPDGIAPSHGAEREGPTAVLRSAAKMPHERTGGTLLNMKFSPQVLASEAGLSAFRDLIRTYLTRLGGHHLQFNVVDVATLRAAQKDPDAYRHLIVRVAGYSDYFVALPRALQDEIIARTMHACGTQ